MAGIVRFALLLALIVSGVCGKAIPAAQAPGPAAQIEQQIPRIFGFEIRDVFGIPTFLLFLVGQLFPAQVTDTFPTSLAWINLSPSIETYKLKLCDRKDVLTCIPLPSKPPNRSDYVGIYVSCTQTYSENLQNVCVSKDFFPIRAFSIMCTI